ncbi:MAG: prepilin peptidase [Planctomycetota bacterium]|nr:prepilin peptidase [Planctomycetota bacterium]
MSPQLTMALSITIQLGFAFAFGSCIGSLINVLAYRMPLGLNVVTPASKCPSCNHVLTWRENIPVFGWLLLRGRCRFCKGSISPEYPIVETIVGLVFVGLYLLWYIVPDRGGVWLGVDWSVVKPEWAMNGFAQTWPIFITLLVLVSSLIAMTIIDARTFTIPLALAWTPTVVALLAHPLTAVVMGLRGKGWRYTAAGEWWALPTPGVFGWPILCATIGAVVGLVIANGLLALGLIKRSFADYDEWESKALAEAGITPPDAEKDAGGDAAEPEKPEAKESPDTSPDGETENSGRAEGSESDAASSPAEPRAPLPWKTIAVVLAASVVSGVLGAVMAGLFGFPEPLGVAAGVLVGVVAVGPIVRLLSGSDGQAGSADDSPAELWIQYPHARREVMREVLFLAPCLILAIVGWYVGQKIGEPWVLNPVTLQRQASEGIPLWFSVLGGVLLGYLVGGGIVWAIRIFGTLGFGKEAMGLGDVHLLAAVGACLGWIDSVLAFFVAPFIALYMVLVQATWTGGGQRAMPYGPYLAVATVAVILGKYGFEAVLTAVFGSPVRLDFP